MRGGIYIFISIPFFIWSLYLAFDSTKSGFIAAPMFIGGFFWVLAKNIYDKNLRCRLAFFTHLDSSSLNKHKAIYLSVLTNHIDSSLHGTMSIFREVAKTNNENRSFVLDNGWYHFFRFLYDPESKNRILSLIIYLISLIAILTVIKPATSFDIYSLIQNVSLDLVISYFIFSIIFILILYFIFVVPTMFAITYLVVPLMLKYSSTSVLSRYFISELNKYAFLEK